MSRVQRGALGACLLGVWTAPWLSPWMRFFLGFSLLLLAFEATLDFLRDWQLRKRVP